MLITHINHGAGRARRSVCNALIFLDVLGVQNWNNGGVWSPAQRSVGEQPAPIWEVSVLRECEIILLTSCDDEGCITEGSPPESQSQRGVPQKTTAFVSALPEDSREVGGGGGEEEEKIYVAQTREWFKYDPLGSLDRFTERPTRVSSHHQTPDEGRKRRRRIMT